jgi:hypothetical protein
VGATVALRLAHGLDPVGVRWNAALSLDGATGTYRFLRPALTVGLSGPLPGPLLGSIEGSAGTVLGEVPAQKVWPLGGTPTLRGYHPFVASGTSYWRARAEVGTDFTAGRLILFSDLGWAGQRESFPGRGPLAATGIGASLLDGLLRVDLARALRSPTGWRLSVATDLAL